MKRREFIALAGSAAAAWPLPVHAQQPMPLIGFLHSVSADYMSSLGNAFDQGLKETGFLEGQNVRIEYRWAEGHVERLPSLVAELLERHVTVIFAGGGTEPARAVMTASKTIPIVFVSAADPVELGFVASLNRPGANVTGVSLLGSALEAKRLELLHELVPKTSAIAVLVDTNYPAVKIQTREVQEAAARLGLKVIMLAVASDEDVQAAFTTAAQQQVGAILIAQSPRSGVENDRIVALSAKESIPAVYWQKQFVALGGLISYGPVFTDGYRQPGFMSAEY